jgi:hydrogenase maturation protease
LTAIVGYGNTLCGEDGFGIEVAKKLQNKKYKNVKVISTYCLTPELCEELKIYKRIIFCDCVYSPNNHYKLACSIKKTDDLNLSHHISPEIIIEMLKNLYDIKVEYEVYSMLSNSFDKIKDKYMYKKSMLDTVEFISSRCVSSNQY